MQNTKVAYVQHQEEEEDEESHQQRPEQENRVTDRSSIMEDKTKDNQFNQSYLVTYTQGNMTTNSNNISISKVDLNSLHGRYKSINTSKGLENMDYPIDSNDVHILSNDQNDHNEVLGDLGRQNQQIIQLELSNIEKDNSPAKKRKQNNLAKKSKKKQIDLQIQIPDSDEEKKQRSAAKQAKASLKSVAEKGNGSQKDTKEDNPESARVNEIIKHNQMDVENLETIQIDYDFETIEGLTDDQCLELYCEGSVKLKNSQRLFCKLAYEQLLIDKIRSTTRLIYSNLGILNNGNLSSQDFIGESVVSQLKKNNNKFRTIDISEAFTVQCSDYIHFNLRKIISLSTKLFFFLSLLTIIAFVVKFQDSVYQTEVLASTGCIITSLIQLSTTYFYLSGIYSCSNESVRRGILLNKFFLLLNLFQFIIEIFLCKFFDRDINSLIQKSNFKEIIFYVVSFCIQSSIPPYINRINKNTPACIRKIVKIVSDEYIT